jgi:hypothetical protein
MIYFILYTLSYEGHNLDQLITVLERDSLTLIDWFTENQMKANPDKFQAIAIGKKSKNENISFNLNGNIIKCEDEVKLLGVTIDFELNFNTHFLSCNIMLNIGKNKYSNSCVVRKKNSERNKKRNPPPFKLNGRSLNQSIKVRLSLSSTVIN